MSLQLANRYPDLSVIIADQYRPVRPLERGEDYWTTSPCDVKTKDDLQTFAKAHTQLIYNTASILQEKLLDLGVQRTGVPLARILRKWFLASKYLHDLCRAKPG